MNFLKRVTNFLEKLQPEVGFLLHIKLNGESAGNIVGVYRSGDKIPAVDNSIVSITVADYVFKKNDTIIDDLKKKRINWPEVPDHRKLKWKTRSEMLEWNIIKGYII